MPESFEHKHAVALHDSMQEAFTGLRMLGDAGLIRPFLVVLYATMDAAAWLAADHDGDVTKADFVLWVDRFVLPGADLECTAIDLYGARCGVLHSASAYSSLQRKAKARLLCYAGNPASVKELKEILRESQPDAVVVPLGVLANALIQGWNRFILTLEGNPKVLERLADRVGDMFGHSGSTNAGMR